jgi:hypothetical protein
MEFSTDGGAASSAAAQVVGLVVEVRLGSQLKQLWLSLSPEEYVLLPVSDLMRKVALQAYDCFKQHVLLDTLQLGVARLDLGRSLSVQGIVHGATLRASATPGNPVHQAAVVGAACAPTGGAAGTSVHAARVEEHVARDEPLLNPLRSFVCHGDCLPGIHCILQGKSTPKVALVPGYLTGTGTRVLSNGYWYDVEGTAKSLDPPCKGRLESAHERAFGMCGPCARIRSDGTIHSARRPCLQAAQAAGNRAHLLRAHPWQRCSRVLASTTPTLIMLL